MSNFWDYLQGGLSDGYKSLMSYGNAPAVSVGNVPKGNTPATWNPAQTNRHSGYGFKTGADPALGGSGALQSTLAGFNSSTAPGAASGGMFSGLGDMFSGLFDSGAPDEQGMKSASPFSQVMGGAKGLFDAYNSMKMFGLAEDQFDQSKEEFNKNYNAQRQTTNANMEDRQRARVASNSGAYQSVSDYMNKNRIA